MNASKKFDKKLEKDREEKTSLLNRIFDECKTREEIEDYISNGNINDYERLFLLDKLIPYLDRYRVFGGYKDEIPFILAFDSIKDKIDYTEISYEENPEGSLS